ncbi:MAG: Cof-type HAD-IIB family hydrolase [Culicoidibacterales bacterium]
MKAIFFDIDDTLVDKESHTLPQSAIDAIQALAEKGHIIGIATGRARYFAEWVIEQLPVQACVTINGQYVEYQNERIYHNPIPREDVEQAIAYCNEHGFAYGCIGEHDTKLSEKNEAVAEVMRHWLDTYDIDPNFYQTTPIYQLWAFVPENHPANDAFPTDGAIRMVRFHPAAADIVSKTGSKANGLTQFLNHVNLTPEDLIVFGDGLNDIEMFELAKTSIAMGAAHPTVKALATYVTDGVLENGLAKAVKQLGLLD